MVKSGVPALVAAHCCVRLVPASALLTYLHYKAMGGCDGATIQLVAAMKGNMAVVGL